MQKSVQKGKLVFLAVNSIAYFEGEGNPPPTTPPTDGKITLTQAELDAKIAEHTAEIKKQQQQTLVELQAVQSKAQLTAKERADLQKRIDDLKSQSLTKEELAHQEAEKLRNQHEADKLALTQERDHWKKNFTETTILRTISDAASANEAFNPAQIIAILKNDTELKETVDADGRPTGNFEARVSFKDVKDGQPITLDLAVADAVKRLREQESSQNLFKGQGAGGSGGHNRGPNGEINPAKLSPEQYRAARKSGKLNF